MTDGFKTFKKEDKVTGIVYARGEGLIPLTYRIFQEYQLESFGGKAEIVYSVSKSMYVVISGRDFTLAVDTFVEG